jgi:glycerophosphoryl diester phosphodiesterase
MKPLIIAHRGASALAPENTLAAFQKAIEDGAEGIEFDVRLAGDGVPVVFHDFSLKRIGRCGGNVSDFTSKELQNLNIGTWFNIKNPHRANEKFAAETVPTFVQLLEFLEGYKGLLYVELKCLENETISLTDAVCKLILESKFVPQVKLKSFNLEAIAHAKKTFPEITTAALFEPTFQTLWRGKPHLIDKAEAAQADELSLHYSLATRKMMAHAAAKNFPVTIWTADNPIWVKRARDLGLQAIITNNPARLLKEKRKVENEKQKI